jgi:ABC-type iron transport system FetAB permease component
MAFLFVAFNLIVSRLLQLQVGSSLLVAALRCMAQLTVVAVILQNVLAVKNMWAVAWITRMFLSISVHAR